MNISEYADTVGNAVLWCEKHLESGKWSVCFVPGDGFKFKFDRDEDHLMFILGNEL